MEIFKQHISKDVFKRKAELSIKRKQGRKETQGGGFFTEEAMRNELKYSQNPGYKFKTTNLILPCISMHSLLYYLYIYIYFFF